MTIAITILLALLTVTFIMYPYFQKTTVKTVDKSVVPNNRTATSRIRTAAKPTGDIDSEIEKKVREIRGKNQSVCPDCGEKNRGGSRFCAQCGAKLNG